MNRAPDCEACLAWDSEDGARGLCRSRPPQAKVLVITGEDGKDSAQPLTCWPETAATGDGCFEHRAVDEAKATGGTL